MASNTSDLGPEGTQEYTHFKALPPGGPLNRWSHALTKDHDFPGAQVSLCFAIFLHVMRC